MSPIAIAQEGSSPTPSAKDTIPRRPSPWTDLAHSLSETSLHPFARRSSSVPTTQAAAAGSAVTCPTSAISTPLSPDGSSPRLSSSALREWDRLLLESSSHARRHHLIHPSTLPSGDTATPSPSPHPHPALRHTASNGSLSAPKLAAERDKDGHIEYKLKLIDPTPDRFERLVTQMLWRLKQGRNEAIYEIGLADDGTVIGLTRAEMDASLSTLEQMAAEVGATVLILKEIVLTGAMTAHHQRPCGLSPSLSSISSSAMSLSSGCSADAGSNGRWTVRRPDLDESGRPRRGSRTISSGSGSTPAPIPPPIATKGGGVKGYRAVSGIEKQVIFDMSEIRSDSSSSSPHITPAPVRRSPAFAQSKAEEEDVDEDVPPFHLDMDEETSVPSPLPCIPGQRDHKISGAFARTSDFVNAASPEPSERKKRKWKRWKKVKAGTDDPDWPGSASHPILTAEQRDKARLKAAKSAAKREHRRMELYKGDGMDPNWAERFGGGSGVSGPRDESLIREHGPETPGGPSPLPAMPHQPNRPSSLRLATPASGNHDSLISGYATSSFPRASPSSSSSPSTPTSPTSETDHFVADLLHIPLDNLSLSFAEVQTVTSPSVLMDPFGPPSDHSSFHASHVSCSSVAESDNGELESDPDLDEQTEYATSPRRELPHREAVNSYSYSSGNFDPDIFPPVSNGLELICVEALVVRKTAEGVAGYKDWCEDGDDAWGFGQESRDGFEDEVEVDPEDTWGFGD